MKILVDLTYIHEEFNTGLANFAFNLLEGIRETGRAGDVTLLVENGFEQGFAHRIEGFRTIPFKSRFIPGFPFTRSTMMRGELERLIRKEGFEIMLSTYMYDRSLCTDIIPTVGVIHDTYQFEKQKSFLHMKRFLIGAVKACNSLTRIVTISNCSRRKIEELGLFKTPVEVIYNSTTSTADPMSREPQSEPYILNINTILPHKNLLTLVRAFSILKDRIRHKIVVKGRRTPYWDCTIVPYLKSNGIVDRVVLIDRNLTREEIDKLYVNADLFVSPSEMEGFGFTPIEAALAGVPVICNALPTLIESTRGLATYYSPAEDAQALADKILYVLQHRSEIDTEAIRATYLEAYSPSLQASSFLALFEGLL